MVEELEVEIIKIVQEPKISLKQFSKYSSSTANGKNRILIKSKYPSGYVPRFYEIARKIICDTFGANFTEYSLYFEEFVRQASLLKKQALEFPSYKDNHKNRICSANALIALSSMGTQILPLLKKYILNSHLSNKRDSIIVEGVKIGAMADMLLFTDAGATQVGFLKFNFTKKAMTNMEAEHMLYILRTFYYEKMALEIDLNECILIDVFSSKIFRGANIILTAESTLKSCKEIKMAWPNL